MNFQEFLATYKKKVVTEYTGNLIDQPLVSVCVQTFQHANYIRNCIDAILIQKVSFTFEIIIGDDGSTDGTTAICQEYFNRFPEKIRLFVHHRENNITINGRPSSRFNMLYNIYHARGKYVAFCDGDDYWLDEKKLQRQVDFLGENPQVGLVACEIVRSDGKQRARLRNVNYFAYDDLFRRGFSNFTHSTRVMRSHTILKDLPSWNFECNSFDTFMLFITLKHIGDLATLPFQGVYYRIHDAGLFTGINWQRRNELATKLRQTVMDNDYFKNKLEKLKYQRQWRTRKWWPHLRSGRVLKALSLLAEHLLINIRIAQYNLTAASK